MSRQRDSQRTHSTPSGIAKGAVWASRASSISFQFVVPAAVGYWVDTKYQTGPWGVVVGAFLGFGVGLRGLLHLVKQMDKASERSAKKK